MDIDRIPLLFAFFWVGFSLSYAYLSWFARIKPQFGTKVAIELRPLATVSYPVRFLLAVFGVAGALGAAGLLGQHRGAGTDTSFLIGLVAGVLIAYTLHLRRAQ
jgi:hypothetical protein